MQYLHRATYQVSIVLTHPEPDVMDALGGFEPGSPTYLQCLGDQVNGCTGEEDQPRREEKTNEKGLNHSYHDVLWVFMV